MQRWVYVVEEVPNVANDNTHDLVPGNRAVHKQAEGHQHPRQVRSREDEQAQEAQSGVGVTARPDVNERRRERVPEEWH